MNAEEYIAGTSGDRHSPVQSLTIEVSQIQATKSILAYAESNRSLLNFFIVTGNYWPKSGHFISKANFIICRLSILYCALSQVIDIGSFIPLAHNITGVFIIILLCMLFLGTLSVLPAQYFNRLRSVVPAQFEDFVVLDECLRVTIGYGIISMMGILVGIVLQCLTPSRINSILLPTAVISTFVLLSLMFNLFFLLLDVKVSLLLLDQLHVLADKKMLTIDKFNMVRAEVHRRVSASRLACDFIIIPSLASIAGIVLSLLLINTETNVDDDFFVTPADQYIGLIFVQLKELLFVAVAFWYVAKVNGRADELTTKLSEGFWGQYDKHSAKFGSSEDSGKTEVDEESPVEKRQLLSDLHRVSIYMSAVSRPVSFTLLFKRVSWENVVLSALGFGVTILVGIIRHIVLSTSSTTP